MTTHTLDKRPLESLWAAQHGTVLMCVWEASMSGWPYVRGTGAPAQDQTQPKAASAARTLRSLAPALTHTIPAPQKQLLGDPE